MAKSVACEKHEWLVLQAPDGRLVIMCDRCQHIAGTVPATGYAAPLRYVPWWNPSYTITYGTYQVTNDPANGAPTAADLANVQVQPSYISDASGGCYSTDGALRLLASGAVS